MNPSAESFRRILRTSTITGMASVMNIAFGIIRTKAAAVLLGPTGVGAIGLLQNLMAVASTIGSLGFRTVGTQNVAAAMGRQDMAALAVTRRALLWGTAALASLGAAVFYALSDVLAERVLHDPAFASATAWLPLGVALSIATGAQSALLSGMRRISDLARLVVASSAVATALGIATLYFLRERGLVAFILAGPGITFLLGHWYVRKLGRPQRTSVSLAELIPHWKKFARLGLPVMLSALIGTLGELIIRTLVNRHTGLAATGNFQAAWAISVMYTGFILTAMSADYYPRLAAVANDHLEATRLINDQTQVALLLGTPLIVLMLAVSPWVIALLYSRSFEGATAVLRWQLVGDVLKLASWPLGYLLLASGQGRSYFLSETGIMLVYVAVTASALPLWGIEGAGVGFVAMYLVYLPVVYRLAARQIGFQWNASVRKLFYRLCATSSALFILAEWSDVAALVLGGALAAALGFHSFSRLRSLLSDRSGHDLSDSAARQPPDVAPRVTEN